MTQIIDSLAEVSDRYDALFCDLWGCVHNGVTAFPEAIYNSLLDAVLSPDPEWAGRAVRQLCGAVAG